MKSTLNILMMIEHVVVGSGTLCSVTTLSHGVHSGKLLHEMHAYLLGGLQLVPSHECTVPHGALDASAWRSQLLELRTHVHGIHVAWKVGVELLLVTVGARRSWQEHIAVVHRHIAYGVSLASLAAWQAVWCNFMPIWARCCRLAAAIDFLWAASGMLRFVFNVMTGAFGICVSMDCAPMYGNADCSSAWDAGGVILFSTTGSPTAADSQMTTSRKGRSGCVTAQYQ
jgi:hypothetical protein